MYIRLYSPSRFDWNADKSQATLASRGFDFTFAARIFDAPTMERVDRRKEYGEERFVAVGQADGRILTVVYTDRVEAGDVIRRIISARRSNAHEREAYREILAKSHPRQG